MQKRSLFFMVYSVTIIAVLCFASCQNSSVKNELSSVLTQQVDSWNEGDIEGYMSHYWKNDSLMFIGRKISYGWNNVLNNYKKAYPDKAAMGHLAFEIISIDELSDESALVVGRWNLTYTESNRTDVGGVFSLLLRKIGGKWVIVKDHTS